ncbi:hypothetical protein GCM10028809_61770 [Spirosoma gilvum]
MRKRTKGQKNKEITAIVGENSIDIPKITYGQDILPGLRGQLAGVINQAGQCHKQAGYTK